MDAKFNDRDEYAESTARILLENADLPLLIRARALIVLGCAQNGDCLEMAEEAIRVVNVGIEEAKKDGEEPDEVIQELLRECNRVRDGAKKFLEDYGDCLDELEAFNNKVKQEQGQGQEQAQAQGQEKDDEKEEGQGEGEEQVEAQEEQPAAIPAADTEKGQKARRLATDPDKTTGVGDSPPKMGRRGRQIKNAAGEDQAAAEGEGEGEGEGEPGESKTGRK